MGWARVTTQAGWTHVEAAVAVPTIGVSLVILTLGLIAPLALAQGGSPGLAAALDPAQPGSLPDLWGQLQLAVAVGAVLWSPPGALIAALLPLALLVADAADLSAHLAPSPATLLLPAQHAVLAKFAAGALLGGVALAPALALWRRSCLVQRRLGRRLAGPLLLGGVLSLLLDANGGRGTPWVSSAEEAVEALLYSVLTAQLLGHAVQHHLTKSRLSGLTREYTCS